jgi:AcrR family transcriptional regulator
MEGLRVLPLLDGGPVERSDAARNREALLAAAQELVHERCGVHGVTMDAVAARAGVGKGTVYRRFESREGLMAALLDRSETVWQASVLSGPPPLGPGAPPLERLLAFGHSRMETNLLHGDLIQAAGHSGYRAYAVMSFTAMHVRYLLTEIGVRGDLPMLATALLAPLEIVILQQQTQIEHISRDRIRCGWDDLVRRVVSVDVVAP